MTAAPFDLGDYSHVASSALRVVVWEPLTWTLAGRVGRGLPRRETAKLVALAAVHTAAARRTQNALVNRREVATTRWLVGNTAASIGRYWAYPALSPRRTFWRAEARDVHFFMQTFEPAILWGLARGPRAAAVAGFAASACAHLGAGWLNGEPLLPDPVARRRIANYTVTGVVVGLFVNRAAKLLADAAVAVEDSPRAFADRAAGAAQRADLLRARADHADSLSVAGEAAALQLDGLACLDTVQNALRSVVWRTGERDATSTVEALATAAAENCGAPVRVLAPSTTVTARDADFVDYALETVLDNARRAGASETVVDFRIRGNERALRAIAVGTALPEGFRIEPRRGLGSLSALMTLYNGGVEVAQRTEGVETYVRWIAD